MSMFGHSSANYPVRASHQFKPQAYQQQQAPPQQYASYPSRPSSSGGAVAVGATLVPSTQYRPPSGTVLNKVPHSARARDQILRDQQDTRDRLRAKAMDRRIREAVVAHDVAVRSSQQRSSSASRTRSQRSKSAVRSGSSTAARHHAQQEQREQAFLTQRDIEAMSQPYQPSAHSRPQSAAAYRGAQAFDPQGMPLPQDVQTQGQGQARVRPQSAQQMQWGRAYEPADRPGQLVSSSTQSRLSARSLAAQPVAGISSGNNAGSDLASILGGGHEHVVFGNRNAPSAQTRSQVPGVAPSPVPNKTLAVGGGAAPQAQGQSQYRYAPFATTAVDLTASLPRRFNDDAGALVVRDDLSLEPRHAPASIGYGKAHSGYADYILKPAAAGRPAQVDTVLVDPFAASANILSWSSDGIERGGTRAEILARQQRDTWTRTSGDYGGPPAGGLRNAHGKLDARAMPVAGATQARHEPLQLSYDLSAPPVHVHGPGCAHGCAVAAAAAVANGSPHGSSTRSSVGGQSLYGAASPSSTQRNLSASSLGYGKKHSAYKQHVLVASADPTRIQQ